MDGQVTEALHRFCRGAQSWDRDLLISALSTDAELDPRAATVAWSARAPRLIGRDAIVDILLGIFHSRVRTTHAITESAVVVDGPRADLRALLDIRHRLLADNSVGADLTYRCTTELVNADSRWVLRRIGVETVRYRGDPAEIYCRAPVARPARHTE
ncbi:nuclear transport factor 2 family protein [Nocardia sp. NPDC052254]|uniref:nuclear transport factor 2 family protein n=1 Tax=Nocardia sp. NPDC052254 TaxID=3155681 RepID=UPI00341658B5